MEDIRGLGIPCSATWPAKVFHSWWHVGHACGLSWLAESGHSQELADAWKRGQLLANMLGLAHAFVTLGKTFRGEYCGLIKEGGEDGG